MAGKDTKQNYDRFMQPMAKISVSWLSLVQMAQTAYRHVYNIPLPPPPPAPRRNTIGIARIDRALENALNGRLVVKCCLIGSGKLRTPVPREPSGLQGKGGARHDNVKLPKYLWGFRYEQDPRGLYAWIKIHPRETQAIEIGIARPGDEVNLVYVWQDLPYPKPIESLIDMCARFTGVQRPPRSLHHTRNMHRKVIIREAQELSRGALLRTIKKVHEGKNLRVVAAQGPHPSWCGTVVDEDGKGAGVGGTRGYHEGQQIVRICQWSTSRIQQERQGGQGYRRAMS